jgi:hypothetical protein
VKGLEVVQPADAAPPARSPAGHHVDGDADRRLVSPADFPLWLLRGPLAPGAKLGWDGGQGDEAVWVLAGELAVGEVACGPGGAVVVERGATVRAVVGPAGAEVVHVGRWEPVVHGKAGGAVHVVGAGGTWARREPGRESRFVADSTCPTCDLTLLHTSRADAYTSAPHSHSADELIHVLEGELRVGRTTIGPGATVAVRADRRYGFRTPGAFAFLNYRSGPSSQTLDRQRPPVPEGGEVHGFEPVMDVVTLRPAAHGGLS